jgi:tape measure domain-containing protein
LSATLGLDDSAYRQGIQNVQSETKKTVSSLSGEYSKAAKAVVELTRRYNESVGRTGKASSETKNLKTMLAQAEAQLRATTTALKAANNGMEGFANSTDKASGKSLAGAIAQGTVMASVFSKLGSAALSAAEGFISSGIEYNAQIEKYTTGFTNMLGSAEAAQQVMSQIQEDAAKTPFDVASLTQANQYLISAGENASYARSTIMALGDAVSATGGGNDELNRMSQNLQQIKNVGKASAADIKQFAMAGIDIYGILADYTEKSTAEVQNMTVTYDLLTAALQKASEEGGRYYNAMETQSQTMSGRIETLKDNWSQLLGTLTEGLTETEGKLVTAASGWVQRLQEAFETSGANGLMQAGGHIVDDIATGISDGIPSLATQAAGAVQNFALYLQDNTGQIVDTGGQLLTSLANGILSTAPIVANAAVQTVSSLAVELWNNADKIFTAGADLLGKLVEGFLSLTGNVIEAIGNITAAIVTKIFTTDWVQIGKDIVSSIGQGILNGVSAMSGPLDRLSYKLNHALGKNGYEENTFEAWAAANGKTSETRYQQGSPKDAAYWKRYGDRLARQYGLNEIGLDTGSDGTDTTSGGDATKTTKTGSTTETVISSISSTATTTAQNALGTVTTSIQTLTEKVKDSAGKIKDRITETTTTTGKEMVNGVATTFKQVETKVNGTVTKVTKTYDDMSKTLLGTFTNISETTVDGITTKVQQAVEKYADGSEHIKKNVTETGQRIGENGAETYEKIITYIDGVQDKVTETSTLIDKSVKGTQNRIDQQLSEASGQLDKGIFGLVKSAFSDAKNGDWASLGLDFVNLIWGEVSQKQRDVISDWLNKALTAVNEGYFSGGIGKAFDIFQKLFSDGGVKSDIDGVTNSVKAFGEIVNGLAGSGGVGGALGSIVQSFSGMAGGITSALGNIVSFVAANPVLALILGVGAVAGGIGLAMWMDKKNNQKPVSHYQSPFDKTGMYDSLGTFSTRAALQYRVTGQQSIVDRQTSILERIEGMLDEHLPDIGKGQVVMDSGELVGVLSTRMATNVDARIGVTVERKARGV